VDISVASVALSFSVCSLRNKVAAHDTGFAIFRRDGECGPQARSDEKPIFYQVRSIHDRRTAPTNR